MSSLVEAVEKLRTELGDTKQAFAVRLGLSIASIVNYGHGKSPAARVLFKLGELASDNNLPELARVFSAAYSAGMKGKHEPKTNEETIMVRAALAVMRNRDILPNFSRISTEIETALQFLLRQTKAQKPVNSDPDELEKLRLEVRYLRDGTAERTLEKLARKRSLETGETFERAYINTLHANPDLLKQYNQQRAKGL